ncbi:DUF6176 family protein [Microbacterium sp. BWT-B31]|uniref:DUF6176 family protein n=1 Tax=Microbacterium sp. BWT-B31 TaxID=3232072 RepID=UPI003527A584
MIHLLARRIHPTHRARVLEWLAEVDGARRDEALQSLHAEGIDHETAIILDTSDGPILVYAMQTDDVERSRRIADDSPRSIDSEHRAVMSAADAGSADARIVLDLRPDPR